MHDLTLQPIIHLLMNGKSGIIKKQALKISEKRWISLRG